MSNLGTRFECAVVFVGIAAAAAGQPMKREAFSRPSLQVRVNALWPEYSDQHVKGAGMILRGEPLEIDVAVLNQAEGPRAKVEADWFARIALTIRPGRQFEERLEPATKVDCDGPPVTVEEHDVQDQGDHLVLGRDGRRWVRCRASLDQLKLVPGRYTLRVEWSAQANLVSYPDRFKQIHPFMFEFEFRDASTDAEELDLSLHMAYRAWHDQRRPEEALVFISQALARQPASSTALVLRAKIRAAQGDCRNAAADWQQAAHVIRSGLDVFNKRLVDLRVEDRERLAAKWQREAETGSCKGR
jgi:hypothetical protein